MHALAGRAARGHGVLVSAQTTGCADLCFSLSVGQGALAHAQFVEPVTCSTSKPVTCAW